MNYSDNIYKKYSDILNKFFLQWDYRVLFEFPKLQLEFGHRPWQTSIPIKITRKFAHFRILGKITNSCVKNAYIRHT